VLLLDALVRFSMPAFWRAFLFWGLCVLDVARFDFPLDPSRDVSLGNLHVVRQLQIHPRLRVATEIARETKCRIRRDAPPFTDNVIDAAGRDMQRDRECVRAHFERHEVFLAQYFAWVHRAHVVRGHAKLPSVMVDDLDGTRAFVCPDEAQTPLIVDANTVLPAPIAPQSF
jgi:hypothetical protein